MKKLLSQKYNTPYPPQGGSHAKAMTEYQDDNTSLRIVELLDSLKIPFSGATIQSGKKRYHVSPFQQISISGLGPVFYINKKNQKIYTVLQRRFKDNYQWLAPGGYVEVPPARCESLIGDNGKKIKMPTFAKIKEATMEWIYKEMVEKSGWQAAKEKINDPKKLAKIFKEHGVKWPKEIDANLQSAWQREVLEETGIDLDKFPQKIILDFKTNKTFMIAAERDRLVNMDIKFCAFLGTLEKEPPTKSDEETEEVRWIALDEIHFDAKKKKYGAAKKSMNPYTIAVIEEALFEVICHQIKEISKIKNPITKQEISRFNTPQNLQSFLIEKVQKHKNSDLKEIHRFLSWEFGELEIGKNLCGKDGDRLYKTNLMICEFVKSNNLSSLSDFKLLNNLIKKIK